MATLARVASVPETLAWNGDLPNPPKRVALGELF